MLKFCRACKQKKDVSEFSFCRRAPDQLNYTCKLCQRAYNRDNHTRNKAVRLSVRKARYCPAANAARRVKIMRDQRATMFVWNLRKRAEKRKLAFDLNQHVESIQARIDAGYCEMSGIPFDMKSSKQFDTPSIDRINNNRGYTYDNIRVVCYGLNIAMNHWGEEVLAKFIQIWLQKRAAE